MINVFLALILIGANTASSRAEFGNSREQLDAGIAIARIVEATDDLPNISRAENQRTLDRAFDTLEHAAPATDIASSLVALRPHFNSLSSPSERATALQMLASVRKNYLEALSPQLRDVNIVGSDVEQVHYNATTIKDGDADVSMRARLALINAADGIDPGFGKLRLTLTALPENALARVAAASQRLLDLAASEAS